MKFVLLSTGRRVGATTLVSALILAINIVSGIALARLLGPDGRGFLAAVIGWQAVVSALATVGLPESVVYFVARGFPTGKTLGTSLALTLVGSSALAFVAFWLYPVIIESAGAVSSARWLLLILPLDACWLLPDRVLRGEGSFTRWNLVRPMPPTMWLASIGVLYAIGSFSVNNLLITYGVLRGVTLWPLIRYCLARSSQRRLESDRTLVRPLMRFGMPNAAAILPTVLNAKVDQLIAIGTLTSSDVGGYVVASTWASVTNILPIAIGSVMMPQVARYEVAESEARSRAVVQTSSLALLASAGTSALGAAAAPLLLPLCFGAAFSDAVPIAQLLCIGSTFSGWNMVQNDLLRGLDRSGRVLLSEFVGVVVTVLFGTALLPVFGAPGLAWATSIGFLAGGLAAWHGIRVAVRPSSDEAVVE